MDYIEIIDGIKVVTRPCIQIIGCTHLNDVAIDGWDSDFSRNGEIDNYDGGVTDPLFLIEFAGRGCYHSWDNPGKKTNKDYIQNIIKQGHGSVLEHVSLSFHIRGVSRTLTHELIRHRVGIGISQASQRFIDESDCAFVRPPILNDEELFNIWLNNCKQSLNIYKIMMEKLSETNEIVNINNRTERIKKVREAVRSVLPGCAETDLVWTCNVRELRHIFQIRGTRHSDMEMLRFVVELFKLVDNYQNMDILFHDFCIEKDDDGTEFINKY